MYDKKSMTKKKWLELQKAQRVTNGMNTGTRTHKTEKNPSRQEQKAQVRKECEEV